MCTKGAPVDVVTTELKGPRRDGDYAEHWSAGHCVQGSFIPNDGAFTRTEFIFTDYIKVHPPRSSTTQTQGSKLKKQTKKLRTVHGQGRVLRRPARGRIAPRPRSTRTLSSARRISDERVRQIVDGTLFEPTESNPMIGWRGCRYYDPAFRPAFDLSARRSRRSARKWASERRRHAPFCRTPKEADLVLDVMAKAGPAAGRRTSACT